jgi:hypothetical protein
MDRKRFIISREPVGAAYRELLDAACHQCSYALLVVRESYPGVERTARALADLSQWLVSRELRSDWPGTILEDEKAAVYRYRLDVELVERLATLSQGLYDWVHPELPEDLCLLREGLDPWLVSVSHEREAVIFLTEDERTALAVRAPSLAPSVRYP